MRHLFRSTRLMLCVALAIGFTAVLPSAQAEEFRANTTGFWDVNTNWEGNTVPTSFARISNGTRNNSVVTLRDSQTLTGGGGTNDRFIFGQGGTGSSLTITSSGSLTTTGTTVHRLGQSSAFTTTINGGTLNVQNASVTSGSASLVTINAGSDVDVGGNFQFDQATLQINGSTATIDVGAFTANASSTLEYTFGATGVTSVDSAGNFTIGSGATLNIDGSAFTGGQGYYDLVTFGGGRSGSYNEADITITGFDVAPAPGLGDPIYFVGYDQDSMFLRIAFLPEPSTALLLGVGGFMLYQVRRRKSGVAGT